MSPRLHYISRNRVALITLLAVALLVLSGVVASRAAFNFRTTNPGNALSAGNLHHLNSKGGSTVFTTSPMMKPGDSMTGTVTITNTGNLPGYFRLSGGNVSNVTGPNGGNLGDVLTLTVRDGTTVVYNGLLSAVPTTSLDGDLTTAGVQPMPTTGANASHTYTVTVTFPDGGTPASNTTGDNLYRDCVVTFDLNWVQNDR